VWADSQNANFTSTANNQFLIRATGGVGINANNPGTDALLVNGSARITGGLTGNVGIGTATPSNLLDVAAGGVIGNSTVTGADQHDVLNRGTKVSFGYNILGSEFNGMRAVVNPGTGICGNSGDVLFYTWECDTSSSREVMRINGSGIVGIGTGSPVTTLDVRGASPAITVGELNNTRGALYFGNSGHGVKRNYSAFNDVGLYTTAGDVYLSANGTTTSEFVLKNNGNVGIGTADPATALHVVGSGDTELSIQSTDNNRRWTLQASGGPDGNPAFLGGYFQIIDRTAGASRLQIETNGNVTIPAELTTVAVNITSDRNAKEQFKPVNARDVLAKVVGLPISEWQYKTQSGARHIGPMAQDFREAFALGRDDKHITSVDADGVALAAIQGLNEKLEEKTQEVDALKKSVAALTELVNKLAAQQNGGAR
jgi:hypothetical protein